VEALVVGAQTTDAVPVAAVAPRRGYAERQRWRPLSLVDPNSDSQSCRLCI